MTKRPGDFSPTTKRRAKERVAGLCSNPECQASTEAGVIDSDGSFRVADCGHIHSASPKQGPRYRKMAAKAFSSIKNAIWLCGICHRKVDVNSSPYPAELLGEWKAMAEEHARRIQGVPKGQSGGPGQSVTINVGGDNKGQIAAGNITNNYHEKPRRQLTGQGVPRDVVASLASLTLPIVVQVASEDDDEVLELSDGIRLALIAGGVPVDPTPHVAYGSGLSGALVVATVRTSVDQDDPMLALARWLASNGLHVTFQKSFGKNAIQVARR